MQRGGHASRSLPSLRVYTVHGINQEKEISGNSMNLPGGRTALPPSAHVCLSNVCSYRGSVARVNCTTSVSAGTIAKWASPARISLLGSIWSAQIKRKIVKAFVDRCSVPLSLDDGTRLHW